MIKILLERLSERFELAEERIYELENGSVEVMKQEQREKRMKENKQSLREIQNTSKCTNICIRRVPQGKKKKRVPQGKKKERSRKKYLKKGWLKFKNT